MPRGLKGRLNHAHDFLESIAFLILQSQTWLGKQTLRKEGICYDAKCGSKITLPIHSGDTLHWGCHEEAPVWPCFLSHGFLLSFGWNLYHSRTFHWRCNLCCFKKWRWLAYLPLNQIRRSFIRELELSRYRCISLPSLLDFPAVFRAIEATNRFIYVTEPDPDRRAFWRGYSRCKKKRLYWTNKLHWRSNRMKWMAGGGWDWKKL